jgi:uncharacterized delta-60 repeat protein
VARYHTDGSLDKTFNGGKVTSDFAGSDDHGLALTLQTDGKIVVAGSTLIGTSTDFALARYNPDGSLDTSFDGDGKRTHGFSTSGEVATAVEVQADGKLVAAGRSRISGAGGSVDFAVARYHPDGSFDTTFDGDGKQTTDFAGGDDLALDMQLQSDGKIVVVGRAGYHNNIDFAVVRYNPDGSLDSSFDSDGKVSTDFFGYPGSFGFNDYALDALIQADGKLLVVGFVLLPSVEDSRRPGDTDFALARYNPDGSLDTSFDADGKLTTDFLNQHPDYGHSVAAQADGKIVVAGRSDVGGSRKFALARYGTGNNTPPVLQAIPLSQAKGTSATRTIAQVSDAEDASTALSVQINGSTSASLNGITLSNLTIDSSGAVQALVQTACSATNAAFTLTVTDSGLLPHSQTLTATITPDTQPPVINCPANVTAVTPANCSNSGSTTVGYRLPTFSDNCSGGMVVCLPPPNSSFPLGTTTIHCTATDASGNTASCSFTATVFDVCIQDDTNPQNVLLWNSRSGEYRFCGNGVTYSGQGTTTVKGCITNLEHTANGRKVKGQADKSSYRASGSFQATSALTYQFIDRDLRNNSCQCQ